MEPTHKKLVEMKSCKNKSTFCCQMGIQSVALLLGLAILAPVNCNMEGDILNAQSTAWNDPYNVLQSWDPTLVNPCTWMHVTCNGNNSIVRVDLGNAGITGPLIPELGGLTNLQYLELYENNIIGAIPASYGNLTNLVSLDLYNNFLTGQIPDSFGNLKSLKFLRLHGNNLSGYLPRSILELFVSGSIKILNVSNNELAGTHRSSKHRVTSIIQDPSTRTLTSEEP